MPWETVLLDWGMFAALLVLPALIVRTLFGRKRRP
jgi:hypothetical protein